MDRPKSGLAVVLGLTMALWAVNFVWLRRDTRPPVWDMALHQTYALNYLAWFQHPSAAPPILSGSGNYPPFVHVGIAICYILFHPGPHIAILFNLPASFLLLGCMYLLAADLAGARAARWTCLLIALTPYLIWMSRETILDYWLSAWVAASLLVLHRSDGFQSRSYSLLFGLVCAFGMLTKWFFGAFLFFPLLWIIFRHRIWRERARVIHCADALLIGAGIASLWYLPNLENLVRYFFENAQIGALEGEPSLTSFQSWIYYLRLLEGYQLFGLLSLILGLSVVFVWKNRLVREGAFLLAAIGGGWLAMTLLRTKDPRFTMPLLGPSLILAGAWLQSWPAGWKTRTLQFGLVSALILQAYAANFGLRWLPQEVVLMRGYEGSLRWDWNLYLQHYFHILGPPRREDWKQEEILRKVADDAARRNAHPDLALLPDLPRFNATNFNLMARLRGLPVRADHLKTEPKGIRAFDGFEYVVMTEKEQGMPWTTAWNRGLNQIIMDAPRTFRLLGLFTLPDGNCARLYAIHREESESPRSAALAATPKILPQMWVS